MKFLSFSVIFIVHFLLLSPLCALDPDENDHEGIRRVIREPGFWDQALELFYSADFEKAGQEFIKLSRVPPRDIFGEEVELPEDQSPEEYGFNLPILDKCYGGICYLFAGKREKATLIAQEIAQDPVFARMSPNQHLFTLFNVLGMNEQTIVMAKKLQEQKDKSNFSRVAQILSGIAPLKILKITPTYFSHGMLMTMNDSSLFAYDGLETLLTNIVIYSAQEQTHQVGTALETIRNFLRQDPFFSTYNSSTGMLAGAEIIPLYTGFLTLRDVKGESDPLLQKLQKSLPILFGKHE